MQRHRCTATDPWTADKGAFAVHPDAKHVGEDYGWYSTDGDYDIYECPHCSERFRVELPD